MHDPRSAPFDPRIGAVVTVAELDDLVHAAQRTAHAAGLIPIAAAVSTPQPDGRHRIDGVGWNRLAEGVPGIHGETGALIRAGRIDYPAATVTSSLAPCPFCQRTLAHVGVGSVRILDATNYAPAIESALGLRSTTCEHAGCVATFGGWLDRPENQVLWARDIGAFDGATMPPVTMTGGLAARALRLARHRAAGVAAGDPPIGAVVLDAAGEVIGSGAAAVRATNDPTALASMTAWRACGGRAHWRDCTLVSTHGPDALGHAMFSVFRFGQLVAGSTREFAGRIAAVTGLGVPVHDLADPAADAALRAWRTANPERVAEYFG